ncbi:hypothetical protein D3C87_820340 [compost metagenome]
MQLNPLLPAIISYRFKLLILRQLPADLTLRQLQQEASNILLHIQDIFQLNQPVLIRQQHRFNLMKLPHAILLMNLQMTERVIGHTPQLLLITPDPQGDLLSHSSAWEEYGSIFA